MAKHRLSPEAARSCRELATGGCLPRPALNTQVFRKRGMNEEAQQGRSVRGGKPGACPQRTCFQRFKLKEVGSKAASEEASGGQPPQEHRVKRDRHSRQEGGRGLGRKQP